MGDQIVRDEIWRWVFSSYPLFQSGYQLFSVKTPQVRYLGKSTTHDIQVGHKSGAEGEGNAGAESGVMRLAQRER